MGVGAVGREEEIVDAEVAVLQGDRRGRTVHVAAEPGDEGVAHGQDVGRQSSGVAFAELGVEGRQERAHHIGRGFARAQPGDLVEAWAGPERGVQSRGLHEGGFDLGDAGAGELVALRGGGEVFEQEHEVLVVVGAFDVETGGTGDVELGREFAVPAEFERVELERRGDGAGAGVERGALGDDAGGAVVILPVEGDAER
jgi:hypothetical protein